MYTDQDEILAARVAKTRGRLLLVMLFVFIVGAVAFFFLRQYVVEVIWSCLVLGIALFFFDNFYRPERIYRDFLKELIHGRRHAVSGAYVSEEPGHKDGLSLRVWTLTDEGGEFIVYMDARKDWQTPAPGEKLCLQVHENFAYSCEVEKA